MDINPSETLHFRSARETNDERHICPLQLEVIRRALKLVDAAGRSGSVPVRRDWERGILRRAGRASIRRRRTQAVLLGAGLQESGARQGGDQGMLMLEDPVVDGPEAA